MANWMIRNHLSHARVIGIDNCSRYGKKDLARSYTLEQGDLCDFKWVDAVFEKHKPDYVMHAAAQIYGVVGFHKYSADILGANATSTHSVLTACVKHGVEKIAYFSSSMVYERSLATPFNEDQVNDLPCPSTGYGLSKLYGERLVQEYHKQYGLRYVIWRPFNVVTPLEHFEKEFGIAHVIPDMVKKIAVDRCSSVEIFGDGQQIRCFTWIGDVADLIATWSWQDVTDQQAYNIGGDTPVTITDLCRLIWQKARPGESFTSHYVTSYQDDVLIRIPDCSKTMTTFNWTHSKTIEQMLDICLQSV